MTGPSDHAGDRLERAPAVAPGDPRWLEAGGKIVVAANRPDRSIEIEARGPAGRPARLTEAEARGLTTTIAAAWSQITTTEEETDNGDL